MHKNTVVKPVFIILLLSVLFTVIIQLDLTRAIFFDNYLNTRQISGVNYYLSLINESSKGNWQLGSPYILEWRYAPYLYPALNINAPGLFKRVLGLDIKLYAAIMGYLSVFSIMALMLMAFSYIFSSNYFGYLLATVFIFFPRVIMWNRTLSPEINFIPLALFLIFYFSNFKFWKREIGLALSTGILFYIYPYYWTFALVLLGISDFWKFWDEKKIIWNYLYKYLLTMGLASWYLAHLWQIQHLSYYRETMARIGFLYSRLPAGWYTQAVLLSSLIIYFFLKKYIFPRLDIKMIADGALNKIVAGLVASLVVLNQQLITNVQMEFNSHYFPVILVFLVAFWGSLTFILISNFNFYKKSILIFLSFLLVTGLVAVRIYQISASFGPDGYIGGKADGVVEWLLKNQIQDKVVYAPEDLGDEINLWTNNYLVWNDNQALQLTPTNELIDRFTYFDITNQNITNHLFDRQTAIFGQTFISSMQKDNVINNIKAKLSGKNFVPATLAEYTKYDFEPMYKKRIQPDSAEFNKYLEKFHVSYLVYRQKDRNSIYKSVPGKIVFESESYLIKKLAP
ncbi:MAG: hypothetical protein Q7S73_03145 [bacterium]|nr:hypothetical protein [bacterium]